MRELQQRRNQFIDSQPGFKETKRPIPLWIKLGMEAREAISASFKYFRHPTEENRQHLGEELIDMMMLIVDMSSMIGIDVEDAFHRKLDKDEQRFPPGTIQTRRDYRRRKVDLGERKF